MQKTYSTSSIGADGQRVIVSFKDGITFEVVPVFNNNAGSYTFPDSNDGGKWRTTNPKPEIRAIRDRNASCNGNLVRLCRMMRSWKQEGSVRIGGLLVDTLGYQFILDWEFKDMSYFYYDYMCRDFFRFMANQDREQEYWRAPGSGQYVHGKNLFQYKANQCYRNSREAIRHEIADPKQEWSAKWREIFGTAFPREAHMRVLAEYPFTPRDGQELGSMQHIRA